MFYIKHSLVASHSDRTDLCYSGLIIDGSTIACHPSVTGLIRLSSVSVSPVSSLRHPGHPASRQWPPTSVLCPGAEWVLSRGASTTPSVIRIGKTSGHKLRHPSDEHMGCLLLLFDSGESHLNHL